MTRKQQSTFEHLCGLHTYGIPSTVHRATSRVWHVNLFRSLPSSSSESEGILELGYGTYWALHKTATLERTE